MSYSINKKKILWGLPEHVEYCKKCVISNQRPSTVIEHKNEKTSSKPTIGFTNGICSACLYHDYKYNKINWENREKELEILCDKHRSKDGSYDVICPGSGGKDSIYVAHILKEKYGMNPLTVTWAPHMYTEIGWKNLQSWIHSGFDNILVTPNGRVHKKLTKFAFENLLHPFQPFIIGQKLIAPRIALEKGIKFIMYGESQAEGGSELDWNNPLMPNNFFSRPKDQLYNIKLGGKTIQELEAEDIKKNDLLPYLPVETQLVEEANIEVHFMSYYKLWKPQDNFYYAAENCNFLPNPERSEGTYSKYVSLDDKIDGFHFFTTFIKFGIGRASYDAAQEIRNHHIDREEAIALVKKFDGQFPQKYFNEFLEYIDLSEQDFWYFIDKARSPHLWKKTGNNWELINQVK